MTGGITLKLLWIWPILNWETFGCAMNLSNSPFKSFSPPSLTHPDGTLQALCRSKHERIVQSFSSDEGRTWTALELTDMPNNNSGIESLTLEDGRHLLVYNHMGGGRRNEGWGFATASTWR